MSTPDSATIRFFWRKTEFCPCAGCARLTVRLDVDFGSLLPEIDAERRLAATIEAPIGHWFLGGLVDWDPAGQWANMRPGIQAAAQDTVREWIGRAREQILGMTGREILSAIDGHKSIAVSIDSAGAGRSPGG